MRGAALLTGLVLLTGCSTASHFPPSVLDATVPCEAGSAEADWPVLSSFSSDWYSSHLRAAGEPRLGLERPSREIAGIGVLRFTWLRSFHRPVVVRLNATEDGGFRMTATELTGRGGYDPGRVGRRVERRLSAEEGARVATLLSEMRVLDLPGEDCPLRANGDVIVSGDGARWIIEADGPAGYRFVQRHSPDAGPVRDLGLLMLTLTGWTYEDIY